MNVLGIESSCDETAASVVVDGQIMLSNEVASSLKLHQLYGGVVPEIAARSHIDSIIPVIHSALKTAKMSWDDIDAIAVTYGAGLGGCLLVGVMAARTLAITKNKPLYAVNHVAGHVCANFINETELNGYKLPEKSPSFPLLALIVSGGHSQLVYYKSHFEYSLLGQTKDDAIGEAFDKVAKIIGLPYPGGPSISKVALSGDDSLYNFTKANMPRYDFSFSGLKTAVLRLSQDLIGEDHKFPSYMVSERLNSSQKANIAASFQRVAIETVVDKALNAYNEYKPKSFVIAGGVASSSELRKQVSERFPIEVFYTDPKLCTDNGAMIACLGYYQAKFGYGVADPFSLAINPSLSM